MQYLEPNHIHTAHKLKTNKRVFEELRHVQYSRKIIFFRKVEWRLFYYDLNGNSRELYIKGFSMELFVIFYLEQ